MTKEQAVRIGNWIKEQRAERGITLVSLARSINIYPDTLRKWEMGEVPYPYIRHGLRYFFHWFDKGNLYGELASEIPESGKPQLATGAWLSWWMGTVGVRVEEMAESLGMTKACVYRWMKPDTKLSILVEYAIRQAMRDLGF